MTHWAANYIGIPYRRGWTDRIGADCFGLLCLVYREVFGFDLTFILKCSVRMWRRIERPSDGCVVLMTQANRAQHVGVWVDANGGVILHAWEPSGAVLDSARALRAKGINDLRFYRLKSWRT